MKTSRFSNEQIVQALRQAESGTPAIEICRKLGITETTFYRWKRRFAGLDASEVRELKQLREENRKLKQLVADLSLDKTILREALGKKMVSPAHRRAAVRWAGEACRVSQRRACRVFRISRRLVWYRSVRPDDAPRRRRLHELAAARVAYGSRRLHVLLRRDGLRIKYKKVHRL